MSKQSRINKAYLKAASSNDVAAVDAALNEQKYSWWDNSSLPKAHLLARDGKGKTALIRAVEQGQQEMTQYLLNKTDIDRHAVSTMGASALHYAASSGHTDIVKILLAAGLDANLANRQGSTPLHYAIQSGNTATVEALLMGGADPNKVDNEGKSAFFKAVHFSKPALLAVLTQYGANPNQMDNAGKSPLSFAIQNSNDSYNNKQMAIAAMRAGADPNFAPLTGIRPITVGYIKKAHAEIVKEGDEMIQPSLVTITPPKTPAAPQPAPFASSVLQQAFINEGLDPALDEQWRAIGQSAIEHVIGSANNPRVIMTTFNFAARQTTAHTRNMLTGEISGQTAEAMDDHPNPAYIEQAHTQLVAAGKTPPVLWPNGTPAGTKKLQLSPKN